MKRTHLRWLAASSLLLCAIAAQAAQHPRYGGTLRVEMRAAPVSLDPTDEGAPLEAAARARLAPLLFDTLFRVDAEGRLHPQLADWYAYQDEGKSWKFAIAKGIRFADGTPLGAADVATSLAASNPDWRVHAEAGVVVIETADPHPAMLAELALPRNSIVRRVGGALTGTGPFTVAQWIPGQRLLLKPNEDYWQGRPFVDGVDLQFGRASRDQALDLDLNRADIVEVSPEQSRGDARRVRSSRPVELFAIAFDRTRSGGADARLREAISLAVDRDSIARGIFQGLAEPAGSLLPQWVSGYAFLMAPQRNVNRARQLRDESHPAPIVLAYSPNDGLARMVAERVALNARDAGIVVQTTPSNGPADAHIVRARVASPDARVALAAMAQRLSLNLPHPPWTLEDAYAGERNLLKDFLVVPVVCAADAEALSDHVKDWSPAQGGAWHLQDVWVQP